MTEVYSVVAAFGNSGDAEGAIQKLQSSGLPKSVMSIENRISPIPQGTQDVSLKDSGMGSWAVTGALLGGFWGVLVNGDRLQSKNGNMLPIEPLLSCLGFAVKGACVFAGVSLISLSMNGEISRLQLMQDGSTLSVDPYLLVVHGTPAAVTLAGDILRAAR